MRLRNLFIEGKLVEASYHSFRNVAMAGQELDGR